MRGERGDSLADSPVRVPAVTNKFVSTTTSGMSGHRQLSRPIQGRQKGDPFRVLCYTDPFFQAFATDVFNKKFAGQLPEGVKFGKVELVSDDSD